MNPSENCFEDAAWSPSNGRFYSNLACKQAFDEEDYIIPDPPAYYDSPLEDYEDVEASTNIPDLN